MASLQERMAKDLAIFDDEFIIASQEDTELSENEAVDDSEQQPQRQSEEIVDEEKASAAAALRDQFFKVAAGPGVSKRSRKAVAGGARRSSAIGNTTKKNGEEEEETSPVDAATDVSSESSSSAAADSAATVETAMRRPLRATKEDIKNSLAANRERRQTRQSTKGGTGTVAAAAPASAAVPATSEKPISYQQPPQAAPFSSKDRRRSSSVGRRSKSSNVSSMMLPSSSNHNNAEPPRRGVRRVRSGEGLLTGGSTHSKRSLHSASSSRDDDNGSQDGGGSRSGRRRQDRRRSASKERLDMNVDTDMAAIQSMVVDVVAEEGDDDDDDIANGEKASSTSSTHISSGVMRRPSTDLRKIATEQKAVRRYKSDDLNSMAETAKRTNSLVVAGGNSQRGTTRRRFRAQRQQQPQQTCSSEDTVAIVDDGTVNTVLSDDDTAGVVAAKPSSTGDLSTSLRSSRRGSGELFHKSAPIIEEEQDNNNDDEEDVFSKDRSTSIREHSSSHHRASRRGSRDRVKSDDSKDPIGAALKQMNESNCKGNTHNKTVANTANTSDDDNTITRNRRGRRRSQMEQALRHSRKSEDDNAAISATTIINGIDVSHCNSKQRRSKSPRRRQASNIPIRGTRQSNNGSGKTGTAVATAAVNHVFERPRSLSVNSEDLGLTSQESGDDSTLEGDTQDYIPTSIRISNEDDMSGVKTEATTTVDNESATTASASETRSKAAAHSLFSNILGRGKSKAKETDTADNELVSNETSKEKSQTNDETSATADDHVAVATTGDKSSSKAGRFKNLLGGLKTRGKESEPEETLSEAAAAATIDQISDGDPNETLSEPSESVRSGMNGSSVKETTTAQTSSSRNKFKGFLSRGIIGASGNKAPESTSETPEESQDSNNAGETSDSKEDEKRGTKWRGIRSGIEFATRLKMTQKENSKQSEESTDMVLGVEATESSNVTSGSLDATVDVDGSAPVSPSKSKKATKWNFAAKLKMNLQQEQKPKSDDDAKAKNPDNDDKSPAHYGLMNSFSSFNEEDLEGISDSTSKNDITVREESATNQPPKARPAMDRRMMMGGFQGASTKFDFSNHTQDTTIVMRKLKEELAAEIQDSGSSLNLDDFHSSADTNSVGKHDDDDAVDAFALLNTSNTSNPPERRTVFTNTLLREPSQRFDFKKQQPVPSPMDAQDTIAECDDESEYGEEVEEHVKAMKIGTLPAPPEENEPSPRPEFKSIEAELLKVVEKKKKKKTNGQRSVPKDLADELKLRVSSHHAKVDETEANGTERKEVSQRRASDSVFYKYPKLSSKECVQLDFGQDGDVALLEVRVHSLYKVEESDQQEHFLLIHSNGKALKIQDPASLDAVTSGTSAAPISADGATTTTYYDRLMQELSDSEKRTSQAKATVRVMEKELQSKRRRYADLEASRNQAQPCSEDKDVIPLKQ